MRLKTEDAMQNNYANKQEALRRMEEQAFDLNDAISAADTVLSKLQGTGNKALRHVAEALIELLSDEKETQVLRINAQLQLCKEQYERLAAL